MLTECMFVRCHPAQKEVIEDMRLAVLLANDTPEAKEHTRDYWFPKTIEVDDSLPPDTIYGYGGHEVVVEVHGLAIPCTWRARLDHK